MRMKKRRIVTIAIVLCLIIRKGRIAYSPILSCSRRKAPSKSPNPTNKPMIFEDFHGID